jgi:sortase (surface protein transpeptidase)
MRAVATRLRTRLLPAILTALGVTFIAAGLLSYTNTASAVDPSNVPDPTTVAALPSPSLITIPAPSPKPSGTGSPSASPVAIDHVATRVVIPALHIDLPIVKPPGGSNTYPLCNVAMYIQELHQPGQPGATYIYAHARTGMFLPLLDQSKINNGAGMKGDLVQVYTSDNMLYEYVISEVRRHITTLDAATADPEEKLWLQTSEGFHIPQKLQVIATPLDVQAGIDPAVAQPKPHPVVCG